MDMDGLFARQPQNPEPSEDEFREVIREARKNGITDKEIADRVGVTEPTIGRWESKAQNAPPNGAVRKAHVDEIEKMREEKSRKID